MQYRIYCEYLVRLLRLFGSLQSSTVYLQVMKNKYMLCIDYAPFEHIQFLIYEQQFGDADNSESLLIPSECIEFLLSINLKNTKQDIVIDDDGNKITLTFCENSFNLIRNSIVNLNGLNTVIEQSNVISLSHGFIQDFIKLNQYCPLNQNELTYFHINKGFVSLNKDSSISSIVQSHYYYAPYDENLDVNFTFKKPKFLSNFLTEINTTGSTLKLYDSSDTDSVILYLDSDIHVRKKVLFDYQVYIKLSRLSTGHDWIKLLDLDREVHSNGRHFKFNLDKFQTFLLASKESSKPDDLINFASHVKLNIDVLTRLFKNVNEESEIYLFKDKMLLITDEVHTLTTVNVKNSVDFDVKLD